MVILRVPRWLVVVVICLPAVAYSFALIIGKGYVLGWQRTDMVTITQVAPLVVTFSCYLAVIGVVLRLTQRSLSRRAHTLIWVALIGGSVLLQLVATAVVEPYPIRGILMRQFSPGASGYFSIGARFTNVSDALARFATASRLWPIHPQNNPPGLPLLFWMTTQLATLFPSVAGALAPTLQPLSCFDDLPGALTGAQLLGGALGAGLEFILATLVVVPLFGFVRSVGGARAAWAAAALYPMTACMLQWASRWDRAFAWFSIGGLWLVELMLTCRRAAHWYALSLGLLTAAALFFTYKLTPVILMLALYFAIRAWQIMVGMDSTNSRELAGSLRLIANQYWRPLIAAVGTFILFWAVWIVGFHFDLVNHFRESLSFHVTLDRPYWPWALYCALDLFDHIGLPLVGLALMRTNRRFAGLWLAFFVTIAVLAGFRFIHDESGRILTWLAPAAVALAAFALMELRQRTQMAIIALAAIQIALHITFLRVISYGVDPLTVPDAAIPASATRTSIRFGDAGEFSLLGYSMPSTLHAGEYSGITYYWRFEGGESPRPSSSIFMHLADSLDDKDRVINEDGQPLNWALPTTCWAVGKTIEDIHGFRVDPNAKPGNYVPLIGMYATGGGPRLHVFESPLARAGAVQLPSVIEVR